MADRDREAARLAQAFHEAYERLAPSFGYETRKASARPWVEVPEPNRKLMEAVCAEVMVPLLASERAAATAACAEIASEYTDPRELRGAASRECALLAGEIEGRIRALSPEGWVGVRRTDLSTLRESADVDAENLERLATDSTLAPEERERCASNATLIRAALARTET